MCMYCVVSLASLPSTYTAKCSQLRTRGQSNIAAKWSILPPRFEMCSNVAIEIFTELRLLSIWYLRTVLTLVDICTYFKDRDTQWSQSVAELKCLVLRWCKYKTVSGIILYLSILSHAGVCSVLVGTTVKQKCCTVLQLLPSLLLKGWLKR